MSSRRFIITLTGPSGSGKTTIEEALIRTKVGTRVKGFTTRPPRHNEVSGESVNFVDFATGSQRVRSGQCVQHAEINGHYYGKTADEFEEAFTLNNAVTCVVTPEGVAQSRAYADKFEDMTVLSYLVTAPTDILAARMLDRVVAQDNPDTLYYGQRMRHLLEKEIYWGNNMTFRDVFVSTSNEDIATFVAKIAQDMHALNCAYL
jgi:guanylate kinase